MPRYLREGEWALKWDCCQGCGTTEIPHHSKGLCRKCYRRQWRENNREHALEYGRQHYRDHLDEYSTRHRQWHADNRKEQLAYMRQWKKDNNEHVAEYRRQYYLCNREEIKGKYTEVTVGGTKQTERRS